MNSTTSGTLIEQKEALRANVLSLAGACPVEECHPEDCPLHQLRKMKFAKRLEWLNALNEDELAYLAAYHDGCLNVKLVQPTGEPDLHRANQVI